MYMYSTNRLQCCTCVMRTREKHRLQCKLLHSSGAECDGDVGAQVQHTTYNRQPFFSGCEASHDRQRLDSVVRQCAIVVLGCTLSGATSLLPMRAQAVAPAAGVPEGLVKSTFDRSRTLLKCGEVCRGHFATSPCGVDGARDARSGVKSPEHPGVVNGGEITVGGLTVAPVPDALVCDGTAGYGTDGYGMP
jgi:hypothetical protein